MSVDSDTTSYTTVCRNSNSTLFLCAEVPRNVADGDTVRFAWVPSSNFVKITTQASTGKKMYKQWSHSRDKDGHYEWFEMYTKEEFIAFRDATPVLPFLERGWAFDGPQVAAAVGETQMMKNLTLSSSSSSSSSSSKVFSSPPAAGSSSKASQAAKPAAGSSSKVQAPAQPAVGSSSKEQAPAQPAVGSSAKASPAAKPAAASSSEEQAPAKPAAASSSAAKKRSASAEPAAGDGAGDEEEDAALAAKMQRAQRKLE
jgi:hypothetical protein